MSAITITLSVFGHERLIASATLPFMSWQRKVNAVVGRATGFELRRTRTAISRNAMGAGPPRRPRAGRDRLLTAPIFVLSSVRSGSTLLRVLLDSHSQLHAPHELHVRRLKVTESTKLARKAMREAGFDSKELEHLLWDRVLHRELEKSGSQYIVDKTPSNVFIWQRLAACWPDARFIFLLRHPWSTAVSWYEAKPEKRTLEEATADAFRYMGALDQARQCLTGLTIRYEDLTNTPEAETRRICAFLGLEWQPGMVDYGERVQGEFKSGLGDWRDKIRSGTVQAARPLPDATEIPPQLRELCVSWGYLPETAAATDQHT